MMWLSIHNDDDDEEPIIPLCFFPLGTQIIQCSSCSATADYGVNGPRNISVYNAQRVKVCKERSYNAALIVFNADFLRFPTASSTPFSGTQSRIPTTRPSLRSSSGSMMVLADHV